MTYAEISLAVQNLTKSTSFLPDLVEEAISLTWLQITQDRNRARISDLLQNRVEISLATVIVDLGVLKVDEYNRLLEIKEIRFLTDTLEEYTLSEESLRVPLAAVEGKPRCYQILGLPVADRTLGSRIYIEPYDQIVSTGSPQDHIYVSYWQIPLPFLSSATPDVSISDTADATTMFDTELVDRAAAYLFIYNNKAPQAAAILSKYQIPPSESNNK